MHWSSAYRSSRSRLRRSALGRYRPGPCTAPARPCRRIWNRGGYCQQVPAPVSTLTWRRLSRPVMWSVGRLVHLRFGFQGPHVQVLDGAGLRSTNVSARVPCLSWSLSSLVASTYVDGSPHAFGQLRVLGHQGGSTVWAELSPRVFMTGQLSDASLAPKTPRHNPPGE